MTKATFQLEPLTCPTCVQKIQGAVSKAAGVSEAKVLFHSSKVKVDFDESVTNAEALQKIVKDLGYTIVG